MQHEEIGYPKRDKRSASCMISRVIIKNATRARNFVKEVFNQGGSSYERRLQRLQINRSFFSFMKKNQNGSDANLLLAKTALLKTLNCDGQS